MEVTTKILPENSIPTIHPGKYVKVGFLGLFSVVFLGFALALVNIAIYDHKELIFWIWPSISLIAGIVFLSLFSLVNTYQTLRWVIALVTVGSYYVIFPKNLFAFSAGVIFLFLMVWFEQRIRAEEKDRLGFSASRIAAGSVNVMIYAFILTIGLNVYANTSTQFKSDPESFYLKLGQSVVKSTRYISGERSGIDFNQTLDDYLQTRASEEDPNYANLSPAQRAELAKQAREQFFDRFDIEVSGNQSIAEIMAQIAVDKIRQTSDRFKPFFPLIFTLIILGLLRTFAFVFRWLSIFGVWFLARLLIITKFFHICKVAVEVDKLEV